jgi:hypothetical protein
MKIQKIPSELLAALDEGGTVPSIVERNRALAPPRHG